jgi:hypothetical protein
MTRVKIIKTCVKEDENVRKLTLFSDYRVEISNFDSTN